eukprot:scaffold14808_cov146-Skeletonema_dohrnii-CCMP3373.AAC.1
MSRHFFAGRWELGGANGSSITWRLSEYQCDKTDTRATLQVSLLGETFPKVGWVREVMVVDKGSQKG